MLAAAGVDRPRKTGFGQSGSFRPEISEAHMNSATSKRIVDKFATEWAMDYGDEPSSVVQPTRDEDDRRSGAPTESSTAATMDRHMGVDREVLPR
jgi:hypothetical protein